METINHEYYVSLEVAKLLEEAGFNWSCREYYPTNFLTNRYQEYAKPTLDVAQRWLREVKGYELWVYPFSTHYHFSFYGYLANEDNNTNFDTYEEAQEAGIKKALEIILEKGE